LFYVIMCDLHSFCHVQYAAVRSFDRQTDEVTDEKVELFCLCLLLHHKSMDFNDVFVVGFKMNETYDVRISPTSLN